MDGGQGGMTVFCQGDIVKTGDGNVFSDFQSQLVGSTDDTQGHQVIAGDDGRWRIFAGEKVCAQLETCPLSEITCN